MCTCVRVCVCGNSLQAAYTANAAGDGGDDKAIVEALKKSYVVKVKELEEAEVSGRRRRK